MNGVRATKSLSDDLFLPLSAELLEASLFGHVKGSFTGAVRDNAGRVAACNGGTLFLDEIGDLPPSLQPKFLRFLQDHEYERIRRKHHATRRPTVTIATSIDLESAVAAGRFRQELLYRLNVIEITLPPLRERKDDIPGLAQQFLNQLGKQNHKRFLGFTGAAIERLKTYSWPGNIRELRNVVERAAILCKAEQVGVEHLPATRVCCFATLDRRHGSVDKDRGDSHSSSVGVNQVPRGSRQDIGN